MTTTGAPATESRSARFAFTAAMFAGDMPDMSSDTIAASEVRESRFATLVIALSMAKVPVMPFAASEA